MEQQFNYDAFADLEESGVTLDVGERHFLLHVHSPKHDDVLFHSRVNDDPAKTASFVIRTKDWATGERAPYFEKHRAADLAARVLIHFAINTEIHGIQFKWLKEDPGYAYQPGDNYLTYISEKDRLMAEMDPEEARIEAVRATWTMQKIALPNGFSHIQNIEERGDESFTVSRPGPSVITGELLRDTHAH